MQLLVHPTTRATPGAERAGPGTVAGRGFWTCSGRPDPYAVREECLALMAELDALNLDSGWVRFESSRPLVSGVIYTEGIEGIDRPVARERLRVWIGRAWLVWSASGLIELPSTLRPTDSDLGRWMCVVAHCCSGSAHQKDCTVILTTRIDDAVAASRAVIDALRLVAEQALLRGDRGDAGMADGAVAGDTGDAAYPPPAVELRRAAWYTRATDDKTIADSLLKAANDGRLHATRRGARWLYSVDEVCALWPERGSALRAALESERQPASRSPARVAAPPPVRKPGKKPEPTGTGPTRPERRLPGRSPTPHSLGGPVVHATPDRAGPVAADRQGGGVDQDG